MAQQNIFDMCKRYHGKSVVIRTKDGREHRGIIHHADNRQVYLRPINGGRNLGGFGYGFGGYGRYGYRGRGFGFGIAIGAIATLVLAPLFLW